MRFPAHVLSLSDEGIGFTGFIVITGVEYFQAQDFSSSKV